jgi:hypothetical protein
MKPNPDQLKDITSGPNPRTNPSRYEDPPPLVPEKPTVVIGPNANYIVDPTYWPEKVENVTPPEPGPGPEPEPGPPVLTALEPAELPVWASDTEVFWVGSGFTENSSINWNGSEEPTKFISAERLSTIVKPSTVQVPPPFSLPTFVVDGDKQSEELTFTFIA